MLWLKSTERGRKKKKDDGFNCDQPMATRKSAIAEAEKILNGFGSPMGSGVCVQIRK